MNATKAFKIATIMTSEEYRAAVHSHIMSRFGFFDEGQHWESREVMLVDLGAGSGVSGAHVLSDLRRRLGGRASLVCVEPYPDLIDHEAMRRACPTGPDDAAATHMCLDAAAFAAGPTKAYTHILLNQMAHHLVPNHIGIFKGIYKQIAPRGRMLIVTRPVEIDFPWFERLRSIWRRTQPPVKEFEDAARLAGFQNITTTQHDLPFSVHKRDVYGWIRSRAWSEFSMLSEEEMDLGMAELEDRYKDVETLTFTDRLLLLSGDREN